MRICPLCKKDRKAPDSHWECCGACKGNPHAPWCWRAKRPTEEK